MTAGALDPEQHARFRAFADVLIAGGHGLPAAGDARGYQQAVDRVLLVRPDLAGVVSSVIGDDAEPEALLARLRQRDPARFDAFAYAAAAAYLMTPQVRRLLGYPGNAPRPEPPHEGEAEYYLADGLLNAVLARGALYRPSPE